MNCLQLDRIPLNNEYLHLPRELLDCCATVINRGNMSKDLVSAMQRMYQIKMIIVIKTDNFIFVFFSRYLLELNSQHHDVIEQINAFEQSLQILEENNDLIQSNKDYKDLQINRKTIHEMLLQADTSNIELHRHMTTIIEHFKILNSSIDQLEKTLPIINEFDGRKIEIYFNFNSSIDLFR